MQKLKEASNTKPTLKETPEGLLQVEKIKNLQEKERKSHNNLKDIINIESHLNKPVHTL